MQMPDGRGFANASRGWCVQIISTFQRYFLAQCEGVQKAKISWLGCDKHVVDTRVLLQCCNGKPEF
jgi:hypothetical protein